MNDEINRINEQNKKIDFPPKSEGDFSQAKNSSIRTNEEDKKLSMVEGIIADLSNQRIDIDATKQMLLAIVEEQNKTNTLLNQVVQSLNQGGQPNPQAAQGQPAQNPLNIENISMLGDMAEKVVGVWKTLKGNDTPIVDEFTKQITENAKSEAIESLNIVHLINKKVKGKLVQDIAGDIAGGVLNDTSKQDTHAPQ